MKHQANFSYCGVVQEEGGFPGQGRAGRFLCNYVGHLDGDLALVALKC